MHGGIVDRRLSLAAPAVGLLVMVVHVDDAAAGQWLCLWERNRVPDESCLASSRCGHASAGTPSETGLRRRVRAVGLASCFVPVGIRSVP